VRNGQTCIAAPEIISCAGFPFELRCGEVVTDDVHRLEIGITANNDLGPVVLYTDAVRLETHPPLTHPAAAAAKLLTAPSIVFVRAVWPWKWCR
jgi:hypothetical protein